MRLRADDVKANAIKQVSQISEFFADRLKVQQRDAGVRYDIIDSVEDNDLVRLLARVHALQAFIASPDGANLLAGYKRAANILKKEQFEPGAANPSPEPAEKALIDALAVNDRVPIASAAAVTWTEAVGEFAFEMLREAQRDHELLVTAIRQREGSRAEAILREHARRSRDVRLKMIEVLRAKKQKSELPGLTLVV